MKNTEMAQRRHARYRKWKVFQSFSHFEYISKKRKWQQKTGKDVRKRWRTTCKHKAWQTVSEGECWPFGVEFEEVVTFVAFVWAGQANPCRLSSLWGAGVASIKSLTLHIPLENTQRHRNIYTHRYVYPSSIYTLQTTWWWSKSRILDTYIDVFIPCILKSCNVTLSYDSRGGLGSVAQAEPLKDIHSIVRQADHVLEGDPLVTRQGSAVFALLPVVAFIRWCMCVQHWVFSLYIYDIFRTGWIRGWSHVFQVEV